MIVTHDKTFYARQVKTTFVNGDEVELIDRKTHTEIWVHVRGNVHIYKYAGESTDAAFRLAAYNCWNHATYGTWS